MTATDATDHVQPSSVQNFEKAHIGLIVTRGQAVLLHRDGRVVHCKDYPSISTPASEINRKAMGSTGLSNEIRSILVYPCPIPV